MQKKDERRLPVSAYIAASVMDCLKRIAEIDNRSISYEVDIAIKELCEKRKREFLSKKEQLRREA